eukprot:m.102031 g.102031  ORF g.102031 m.102031 type:complete len:301 (-) comp8810_c1_seq2:41-943(-)
MAATLPNMRLVLIVRDPVQRAYSEYHMKLRRVQREFDFDTPEVVAACTTLLRACYPPFPQPGICRPAVNDTVTEAMLTPAQQCLAKRFTMVPGLLRALNTEEKPLKAALCMPADGQPTLACLRICVNMTARRPESVGVWESIVPEEMAKIRNCSYIQDDQPRVRWGEPGCWPAGVTSDIRANFLIRGIYMEQIAHYLKYFRKEQLLVIADTDLRRNLNSTMQRVFRHTGLPEHDVTGINEDRLHRRMTLQWPQFEVQSGWDIHSRYDPMPDAIRDTLRQFYKPYNARLFSFVGRDFGWDT